MDARPDRNATAPTKPAHAPGAPEADAAGRRFQAPGATSISLCCEISAYAPDETEPPLF